MVRKIDDLTVGWLETNVRSFVETDVGVLQRFPFALITSIDSTTALSSAHIGRLIVERYPQCRFLGEGIMIPDHLLLNVIRSLDLFRGFDEAWFFEIGPSLKKPNDCWLVGPLNLQFEELPPPTAAWMRKSMCKLGVGDGIGMNYVAVNEGIDKEIERESS